MAEGEVHVCGWKGKKRVVGGASPVKFWASGLSDPKREEKAAGGYRGKSGRPTRAPAPPQKRWLTTFNEVLRAPETPWQKKGGVRQRGVPLTILKECGFQQIPEADVESES